MVPLDGTGVEHRKVWREPAFAGTIGDYETSA